MNIENVTNDLIMKIPELKTSFQNKLIENKVENTDSAYVIWGMAIVPCVIEYIKNNNIDIVNRIFIFFEEMANSDENVKELLMYSILEKIGDDPSILATSRKFMGKQTMELSNSIEDYLGR